MSQQGRCKEEVTQHRLGKVQSRESSGALSEIIPFDSEPLQGGKPEVAQRYPFMVLLRGNQVSLVLQSSPRHQHGQVLVAVPGSVTHSTAHDYQGIVKNLGLMQTVEQAVHLTEYIILSHL